MMSADGWDLEEIRRRADLVELVSAHVRLRKAGRRLVGLCPFHQEKTPSFTVDPEKGLWHCFGCKAGGDLFRFVEMTEKVPFGEAVELLADRLGLPTRQRAGAARQRDRERMLALHEEAAKLFQAGLRAKTGAATRAYLEQRGIAQESIEGFGLGHAPDSWVWGLIVALTLIVVPQETARFVGWNVAILFAVLYLAQGSAIVDHYLRKAGIKAIGRGLILALVLAMPSVVFVVTIGIVDIWADFRKVRVPVKMT